MLEVDQRADRSAALLLLLSLPLQHPPHAGTTAASAAERPANNLQPAIHFPPSDGFFLLPLLLYHSPSCFLSALCLFLLIVLYLFSLCDI